ncbi:hypothetical protein BDQ17DRAFT_637769 [Cyathus striatus]|nr:hypothetical protein BDQ17DRAFT_637769 [Cyathus striatus]
MGFTKVRYSTPHISYGERYADVTKPRDFCLKSALRLLLNPFSTLLYLKSALFYLSDLTILKHLFSLILLSPDCVSLTTMARHPPPAFWLPRLFVAKRSCHITFLQPGGSDASSALKLHVLRNLQLRFILRRISKSNRRHVWGLGVSVMVREVDGRLREQRHEV